MNSQPMVKIKVHGGGGWEGHVVYNLSHPTDPEIKTMVNTLSEIEYFCQEHNLVLDNEFVKLVSTKLLFDLDKKCFVIPLEAIDENAPISSAYKYLAQQFKDYY